MSSVAVSIVLPCYNPIDGWVHNIEQCMIKLQQDIGPIELIVVNDGSINKTLLDGLEETDAKIKFNTFSYSENKGKGFALRQGVGMAKGDLIIYTDIDFPYTHESLLKIYSALKDGNTDVAIGIRGAEYYTHLPQTRVRISKLLRWFIKKFLRIPTDDTQCGLKGFNQKGKQVFLKTTINRYLFDLEFIFLTAREKLAIKTIEVELRPEIVLSRMNWKILLQEFGNFLKIFVRSFF